MQFAKQLRDRVASGEITRSVRIWQSARVKAGGRYRMGQGHILVTSIREIGWEGITPELARESGFSSKIDLLKTAKHGPGETVYLVEFEYKGPAAG
ncbi:MAG: ASCH domain-containing protein [Pseudomonadota bacterium]